ncbi:hypothetical protein P7K49_014522 [Saguinus oedipus]|uniref:Uncharacterized protein n=1 Tax=Saguinus oedipus TaxID=9490 RepID=A0ABQ9VM37_SAGOE|nr:hypothetical protein P7K49_014522 [Saguinus oedipus]
MSDSLDPNASRWPKSNRTALQEFIILDFSTWPLGLRIVIFALLFLLYLATLVGNLLILGLALEDSALHSPMCFFLGVLFAVETTYMLVLILHMLASFLLPPRGQAVAPSTCTTQMGLFMALGGSKCLLPPC